MIHTVQSIQSANNTHFKVKLNPFLYVEKNKITIKKGEEMNKKKMYPKSPKGKTVLFSIVIVVFEMCVHFDSFFLNVPFFACFIANNLSTVSKNNALNRSIHIHIPYSPFFY